MNNLQQMLKTAQLAQKKHEDFKKKIFEFSKQNGLIKITVSGSYKITLDVDFKHLLIETDGDFEMINDLIQVAINETISEVKKSENKILNFN